jgi:proliferating cell nuclear antigen
MKLVLADSKLLSDSISIISELVNEARIKITKDHLEIISMDPANVAMIIFKLLSSSFVEYELDKDKEIAVNLESLKQILRRAKPSDTLTITLDEEKNKLSIKISGETTRTFSLSLIEIDEKEQKVPDLKFPIKINTNTITFDEAIEDMNIVSESVAFIAEKNKLTLQSSSNLNSAKVEIPLNEDTNLKEAIKSKYSLEYLKKMVKAGKLTDKAIINFDKDYPLKLEYNLKDKLSLSFILAPRIDNV